MLKLETKQDMIQYAQKRIVEIKTDLANEIYARWVKELQDDLKRWEDQLKELEENA